MASVEKIIKWGSKRKDLKDKWSWIITHIPAERNPVTVLQHKMTLHALTSEGDAVSVCSFGRITTFIILILVSVHRHRLLLQSMTAIILHHLQKNVWILRFQSDSGWFLCVSVTESEIALPTKPVQNQLWFSPPLNQLPLWPVWRLNAG